MDRFTDLLINNPRKIGAVFFAFALLISIAIGVHAADRAVQVLQGEQNGLHDVSVAYNPFIWCGGIKGTFSFDYTGTDATGAIITGHVCSLPLAIQPVWTVK